MNASNIILYVCNRFEIIPPVKTNKKMVPRDVCRIPSMHCYAIARWRRWGHGHAPWRVARAVKIQEFKKTFVTLKTDL